MNSFQLTLFFTSILLLSGCSLTSERAPLPRVPGSSTFWSRPSIAADSTGGIHLVWVDLKEEATQPDQKGDVLYYSRRKSAGWSHPDPIAVKTHQDWFLSHPELIGSQKKLFVTWSGWTGLYFSSANVSDGSKSVSWRKPRRIVELMAIDRQALTVGRDKALHLLFSRLGRDLSGDGNVYYLRSDDFGGKWTEPVRVSNILRDESSIAALPQLVEDQDRVFHAVWAKRSFPNWMGRSIEYSSSRDGGMSWSHPRNLFSAELEEEWADAPNLVTTPDGNLHLIWTCGSNPARCYSYSKNGGVDWTQQISLFGDLVSLAGWDALVSDDAGNLHFITQFRHPYGMYYAVKKSHSEWSDPIAFETRSEFNNGHYPQAVFSPESGIHSVWQQKSNSGNFVYSRFDSKGKLLELSSTVDTESLGEDLEPSRGFQIP